MKKESMIILAALLGLFFSTSGTNASYLDPDAGWKNITTYDGLSGDYGGKSNRWWANTNEDQEVEPGAATGQQWDLEGFFLNEDMGELAMVGGFDFAKGLDGIGSGDIFIDTDMTNDYYEYVLDLAFTDEYGNIDKNNKKYTVYKNDEDNPIEFNLTHGGPSGPTQGQNWTYAGGGSAVTGYENIALKYLHNKSNNQMSNVVTGGKHNAVIVDISFLGSNATYSSRLECGNDGLQGNGGGSAAVPEPATVFLLGSGLLGLFGFRKKIRKTMS